MTERQRLLDIEDDPDSNSSHIPIRHTTTGTTTTLASLPTLPLDSSLKGDVTHTSPSISTTRSSAAPDNDDVIIEGDVSALPWTSSTFCVLSICLVSAIEYSVVFPSIWNYLRTHGGSKLLLGFALGVFSVAKGVSLPFVGRWSDRTTYRKVFMTTLCGGIVGYFLYGIAGQTSIYLVLAGRAIAGVGSANTAVINSYVMCISHPSKRTRAMSFISAVNMFGLMLGPATNLLLHKIHWVPSDNALFILTENTTPAYLVCTLEVILCIVLLFVFEEPARKIDVSGSDKGSAQLESVVSVVSVGESGESVYDSDFDEDSMQSPLFGSRAAAARVTVSPGDNARRTHRSRALPRPILRDSDEHMRPGWYGLFIQRSGITCMALAFTNSFLLSGLETGLTPMTYNQYGWGSIQNSYMFAGIAVIVFIGIVVVFKVSTHVPDRYILLSGQLIEGTGLALGVWWFGDRIPLWSMLVVSGLIVLGLPPQGAPNTGLFSKLIDLHGETSNQGFYLGIQSLVNASARCIAPIGAGAVLEYMSDRAFIGLCAIAWLVSAVSLLTTFPNIAKQEHAYSAFNAARSGKNVPENLTEYSKKEEEKEEEEALLLHS
jgi:MFS family permease